MFVLFLSGCFLMANDESPDPGNGLSPVPTLPNAEPSLEPEPVTVAPTPILGEPDSGVRDMTNETLARQLASASATFDAATTAEQLALAYELTMKACADIGAYAQENNVGDVDYIASKGPGLTVQWEGEGTIAVFRPTSEAWVAKAATTPGDVDDTFFAMSAYVYGSASAEGWTVWQIRNWDYGGCSGLGTGVVLESMTKLQVAAQAGDLYAEPIRLTREAAMREMTRSESTTFQYCDPNALVPTADHKLQGEVQQVLDTIDLTDEERVALLQAKPTLHGEVFQGG